MSKFDTLIQQVEKFESLATSQKPSILQRLAELDKLAQRSPEAGDALESYARVESGLRSILEHLKFAAARTNSTQLNNTIARFESVLSKGLNIHSANAVYGLLVQLERTYGTDPEFQNLGRQISPFVRQMGKEIETINYVSQEALPPAQAPSVSQPTAPVKPEVTSYPPIDKSIQAYLNRLGSPFKIKEDGKLGPETRKALDWFKRDRGMTPTTPDRLVFTQIMNEYSKANKGGLPFPHDIDEEMARRNQQLAQNK